MNLKPKLFLKMKKIIFLFVATFFYYISYGQAFDNLQVCLGVKYNPQNSELINKQTETEGLEVFDVIKTKLDSKSDNLYLIQFSTGPSDDPGYFISLINENGSLTEIANFSGEELIIPGNGLIYKSGRMNELYTKRFKYKLENNKLVEVPQTAYYVGLKTITRDIVVLYSGKNKSSKLAVLPKEYKVEILVEENGWILVKTDYGLTGWVNLKDILTYPPDECTFEDFFFMGD